eukprot:302418-Chlamydomonas_euryale.AAC.3
MPQPLIRAHATILRQRRLVDRAVQTFVTEQLRRAEPIVTQVRETVAGVDALSTPARGGGGQHSLALRRCVYAEARVYARGRWGCVGGGMCVQPAHGAQPRGGWGCVANICCLG